MTPKKNHPGTPLCRAVLMFLLTIAPNIGWGQANVPTPASLPPAAQEALNKGIIAAKVPDYLLAIRFFEEARKLAPQAPDIYLNLGLAESGIPGRELRATAWFGAYLAASPTAPNKAAVKEHISALGVKSQSNLARLIKSVQDAASQTSGDQQSKNLDAVVALWAGAGDIAGAQKTADLIQDAFKKSSTQTDIAEAQITAGDIAGALKTLASAQKTSDLIQDAFYKSNAQSAIAEAQITAGDIAGALKTLASAQKTADLIQDASDKSHVQRAIAEAQIKAGDIAGAQKSADLIQDVYQKSLAQRDIAAAQAKSGDIAGALKTLAFAQKTADLIQDAFQKSNAQSAIAEAQIKAGDIAGALKSLASAQKTADLIQDAFQKSYTQLAIAEDQITVGDIAGALKTLASAQTTADLIQDAYQKNLAQKDIAESKKNAGITNSPNSTRQSTSNTQPPIQPVITVSDWLEKLDGKTDDSLNTEPFLDLAGYLKSLPPSDDPQKVFESLHETAEKIVSMQNVIYQMLILMLKQQAI